MVGRGTIRGMTDRFTADPRLGHPLLAGNHDAAHPMRAKALAGHPRFLRAFDTVAAATTLKIEGRRAVVNHFPYDRDHTEPDRHVLVRAAAGRCGPLQAGQQKTPPVDLDRRGHDGALGGTRTHTPEDTAF